MKKTRLHCKQVALHICDNLDEKLHSARCREIRKHLAKCPNCTAYLNSMKKTVSLYKRVKDPRLTGKVRLRLHAVLKLK
ncbi:MAG: zf-HC2 domain-containing protein [Bacteroidota bacterium]